MSDQNQAGRKNRLWKLIYSPKAGSTMGTIILEMLENAAIAVSGFLIKIYVFLEPDMKEKMQRMFYCASFLITGIVFLFLEKMQQQ